MKALTLTQPYATLVAVGAKTIETRSWRTAYVGPVAIHAAIGFPREYRELCGRSPFREVLDRWGYGGTGDLPAGAVVAVARLTEVRRTSDGSCWSVRGRPAEESEEYAFGDYGPGRFMWFMEEVRRLTTPIPAKGALGLWEWTPPAAAMAALIAGDG